MLENNVYACFNHCLVS